MKPDWGKLKQQLKRSRRRLSHVLRLAAVALPVLWLVQHALLGDSGYLALRRQQQQYQQQMARVQALEAQNRQLNQAVKELRSDPAAIEDIAREQLHLTKPGEVVYTYPVAAGSVAAEPRQAAIAH